MNSSDGVNVLHVSAWRQQLLFSVLPLAGMLHAKSKCTKWVSAHEGRSPGPHLLKMTKGTYARIVANCAVSDDGGSLYADTSGQQADCQSPIETMPQDIR